MSFTQFIKPYPDGYEDFEVGGTPVTAEILNTNYDGFLLGLNEFLPELAGMVEANPSESATAGNLTKLKVGNSIYLVPSGGSGGSTVEWEQLQITGTKIATITIDNVPVDVYAPSGGGSGDEVSWNQVLGSGTEIGTITINGTPTTVYAPTPIDVEANPSGSATAGDLTKLKVGNSIYSIPSGGSGGASDLSDLGDVTITNVQNGQILKWNSTTSKWENVNDTGGGSGHTIIDENGNSMTARAGLQFVGGANVSDDSTNNKTIVDVASAGGIDGVFIDTGNVIQAETSISASGLSYTATEDCFVYLYIWGSNSTTIKIDNMEVGGNYSGDKDAYLVPLKKGQTLTTTSGNANNTYTVYGIQTGTTHSKFQPVIYSTEEREIGVWTDGKPLYEKTIKFEKDNTWTGNTVTLQHGISDVDFLFVANATLKCISSSNVTEYRDLPNVYLPQVSAYGISVYTVRTSEITFCLSSWVTSTQWNGFEVWVTFRYTKSTDVAGSGSWTPQGVPTHHYSTDEHIIGTWISRSGNEVTLYEKTYRLGKNSDNINANILSDLNIAELVDGKWYTWESSVYSILSIDYNISTKLITNKPSNKWTTHIVVQYTKSV